MSMTKEESWLLKEKYNGEKSEGFFTDCERLKAGEPLAYVIGHIPFLGTTIYLDSHPLIPRAETEYWVEKAIEHIRKCGQEAGETSPLPHAPLRILDLCAGSGAIGVAVKKAVPGALVTCSELEAKHIPTIKKNMKTNRIIYDMFAETDSDIGALSQRDIAVVESDLFASIHGTYNFILTNPPYIDPAIDRTEHSVKSYEPHTALYGGTDGMELIERIITKAPQYLAEQGELWIEHEPEQSAHIAGLAHQHGMVATVHMDQYQTERFSVLRALLT
jgi:release factor glutamine methyltransferase